MAGKNVWVQDIQMFDSDGNVVTNSAGEKAVNTVAELTSLLSGEDQTNNVMVVEQGRFQLQEIAAGAEVTLGATGAAGDYIDQLLIIPYGTLGTKVELKDGAGSLFTVWGNAMTAPYNQHTFFLPIHASSQSGAWTIKTGASVLVRAVGRFTA